MTEPPGYLPPPPSGSPSGDGPPVDTTAAPELPAWQYPPAQRRPAPPSPYPSAAPQPPTPQYQVPPQGWATAQPRYAVAALPNKGVNGFAIASLVLGICGGLLLSVIFGIVALVQIKNNGGRGKGMAIAGLAVSGLWVLAFGVAIAYGALEGSRADRDPVSGQVTQGSSMPLADLSPGDCIKELGGDELTYSVRVVPCTDPHRYEVTAVEPLHGAAYPGDAVVDEMSGGVCYDAAVRYAPAAMAAEELEVEFFKPTRDTWAENDKTVICLVLSEERFTSVAG